MHMKMHLANFIYLSRRDCICERRTSSNDESCAIRKLNSQEELKEVQKDLH